MIQRKVSVTFITTKEETRKKVQVGRIFLIKGSSNRDGKGKLIKDPGDFRCKLRQTYIQALLKLL